MLQKIKEFILPTALGFEDLPSEIREKIIRLNIANAFVFLMTAIIAILNFEDYIVLILPVISLIVWISLYFSQTRPYFTGKIVTLEGTVIKNEEKSVSASIFSPKRKNVLNKKVVIKVDDYYCTFNAPVKKQYDIGSEIIIYTKDEYILSKNQNTYHIIDYVHITTLRQEYEVGAEDE